MLHLRSNGAGLWFTRCHGCHATTPPVESNDDLGTLAACQRDGWRIVARTPDELRRWPDGGRYRLWCPTCTRRGWAK